MTAPPPARDPRLALGCDHLLSGLARDLVAGRHRELLAPLVFAPPGCLPSDLVAHPGERASLAAELERANASYGHPRAGELAERFARPDTLVVVAGQQAGLFGGPLYTLTKMAGAALAAERLERAGQPAIAAFWVATEDHDYAEVARATLAGAEGAVTLELGDDPAPLEPVGMRTLGPGVAAVLESARALYPGPWGEDAWRLLAASYRPDARFGEAFAKLMVGILGERAPLLVDSMLPSLKRAERPLLQAAIAKRREIAALLGEQGDRIRAATGRALQVEDDPTAAPLFVLAGRERRRVVWEGDGAWSLRGAEAPPRAVAELQALQADNPAVVSPGVLLRPLAQDAALGTALQLMGPGELAYLAQAAPLYRELGVAPPRVALRPQMLVLDRKQRAHLESLGLTLAELLAGERELDERLARASMAPAAAAGAVRREGGSSGGGAATAEAAPRTEPGAADRLESLRRGARDTLASIEAECLALDPNLERPLHKTRDHVEHALELFAAKLYAAAARRDETVRARCDALRAACLPGGVPQERALAVAHFALRYGLGFGAAVLDQLEVESDRVAIVDPEGKGA